MGIRKKSLIRAVFILFIFLVFFGLFVKRLRQPLNEFPSSSEYHQEAGVVSAVYDGDTIKVRFKSGLQKKVRLIGIDAPEIDDEREDVQFLAFMAKRFAFFHLYQEEVKLSYDWQLEDEYGRLLAYVWTKEGLFNDFILREGFASAYLKFPFKKDYQKRFKESEESAQENRKGFWRTGNFPQLKPQEARDYLGELISVQFQCTSLESKRQFLFLNSSQKIFSALIPQKNLSLFLDWKNYLNRNLIVTGFLEEYRSQSQIMVFLPSQVKIVNNEKTDRVEV
jgi:micrococcal nuclease